MHSKFEKDITDIYDKLLVHAYALTRDRSNAKDLVQDTMLAAFRHKEKFDVDTNINAWCYTILQNTFINSYRKSLKKKAIIRTDVDEKILNINAKYSINTDDSTQYNQFQSFINELDAKYKTPFEMYIIGYEYTEIAKALQLAIGTVKSRIFKARQLLKLKIAYDD